MSEVKLWRYVLKSERGEGWAIFVLGSDGYFSAVSDYGSYAFLWTHHDHKDFREFLLRADRDWDYFVNKLHHGKKHYDGEETKKFILQSLYDRMDGIFNKQDLDREIDLLENEYDIEGSEHEFFNWCSRSDNPIDMPYEMHCECYPPDVMNFVKKAMLRLIPLLKKDLEAEYGEQLSSVQ